MSPRPIGIRAAWLAASLALVAALNVGAARAEVVALTGGTVHPVTSPEIPNGTVVFENGRITAVGAVAPPAGARIVPCAGKHVYPGIVSPNTVLGLTEVSSVRGTNDFEEAGQVNPDIRAEVGINPESDLIPVTRANGVTSVMVAPRGGSVGGTAALVHTDGWTFEDMTVKAPVGLFVKWPNMTPVARGFGETRTDEDQKKERDKAIAEIRNAFEDARAYWTARNAEGKGAVPRHDRDVKWDAMGKALRGEIPVMFEANRLNQIRAVLGFADEQKLTKVIIVDGADSWRVASELKRRNIAVIAGPTLELPVRRYEPYDYGYSVPAKLAAAGVTYCISDGGSAGQAANARNIVYHAAMAAAFGLPKEEALKAVTIYPAQILGVADQIGSIEAGKLADLIVTDGDPLEIATHVEQVWIAGRETSMENKQTRLFKKYDEKPKGELARKH
jgi:imidazolonepropionase-like amidohydrolase